MLDFYIDLVRKTKKNLLLGIERIDSWCVAFSSELLTRLFKIFPYGQYWLHSGDWGGGAKLSIFGGHLILHRLIINLERKYLPYYSVLNGAANGPLIFLLSQQR